MIHQTHSTSHRTNICIREEYFGSAVIMNPMISCALLVAVVCAASGNSYGGNYNSQPSSQTYQSNSHQPPPQQYKEQQSYAAPANQQYQQQSYSQQSGQQYQSSSPANQNSYSSSNNGWSSSSPSSSSSSYQQPETIKISISGGPSNSYSQPQSGYKSSSSSSPSSYEGSAYGGSSSTYGGSSSTYGGSSSTYGGSSSSYGGSAPKSSESGASIIKHNQNIQAGHSYSFEYATSNGIQHSELTTVNAPKTPGGWGSITKTGQYSYTSPEGQPISLSYQADEEGFKAQGAHLPVAPVDPNHAKSNSYSTGVSSSSGYSSYNNRPSNLRY